MSVKVAGYAAMAGTAVMFTRFAPPATRLLTTIALPTFDSGIFSVEPPEEPTLKKRMGKATEPMVLETTSVPALTLMVLKPPPEVMVLAMTVPAVLSLPMVSVAVTGAMLRLAPLVRARFRTVLQMSVPPLVVKAAVPVDVDRSRRAAARVASVAFPKPISRSGAKCHRAGSR